MNKNVAIGAGCLAFAGLCGSIPLVVTRMFEDRNLTSREKALTGTQVQRGAFLNSGALFRPISLDLVCCDTCILCMTLLHASVVQLCNCVVSMSGL